MTRIPPNNGSLGSKEGFPPLGNKHAPNARTIKGKTSDAMHRLIGLDTAPPKRRIETLTPPENVIRPTDVLGVGDLHGNIDILYKNLKSLGVINTFGRWIGGSRRLVFLGDIIGDRGITGLECMRQIDRLRNEARADGGDISVLAGNHEDIAIGFLTKRRIASTLKKDEQYTVEEKEDATEHAFSNAQLGEQGVGIIEFPRDYLGFDVKPTAADMKRIRHCGPPTLRIMRDTPEGMAMLANICQIKIAEHIDDTLFVHTALTSHMARMIASHGIDFINNMYQQSLYNLLISKERIPPHPDYYRIMDTFLFVNNRENDLTEEDATKLRQMGFNRVIHGHEDTGGLVINVSGLQIRSIDHSAGRKGGKMWERSIYCIKGNVSDKR